MTRLTGRTTRVSVDRSVIALLTLVAMAVGCSDWERSNPCDPENNPGEIEFFNPVLTCPAGADYAVIELSWTPASCPEYLYRVWRRSGADGFFSLIGELEQDAEAAYVDTVPRYASESWDYQVEVVGCCGQPPIISSVQSVNLVLGSDVGPPAAVAAWLVDNRVPTIGWSVSGAGDFACYVLLYSVDSDPNTNGVAIARIYDRLCSSLDDHSLTHFGDSTRHYVVRVRDLFGQLGDPSGIVVVSAPPDSAMP